MSEYDDLLARVRGGESPVAAAPAVDDYDNLLKEVRGQNTTVAQANLNIASIGNPASESEKAVLARQLKDKLGEDWAAPAVDPVEAKRRLMVAENDHVLQNSPKLAKQYLDTGFAAQTFDDVPNLGIVEGAVNAVKSLSGAVGASVWGINSAGYGLARAASENLTSTVSTPSLWLAEQQRNAEAARKASANFGGDLAEMPIMGPVYQGVQSAYQNMLLMPLAFLRNSAAAAVVPMSMITAGQSYGQARDENNASPLKSLGFAAAQGTAEAATEMLPMGRFLKDVQVGAPVWKMMRNQLVTENLTEQAATAWQDFNEWAMLNPDKPFQSYLDARPGAALDTLIATTTATLLQTGAVQGAMRSQIRQNRAAQAEQAGQALDYLNTSIGNTELSKRDRTTLQQFLQAAAEDDDGTEQTVRINALAFENTLMQAGVDVGQVLEQLPTAKEQWAVAKEVGGDLVLPLSEVAAQTFGTDVGNALLPHIAVGEEAMSLAEAQDFQKGQAEEFRKQAEVVMAEKARDDVFVQSAQEVEQAIVQQLATANRFTPDVNRAYSTMMRDFYVTTAARMGITPGELFQQFPLNIVAEGQGGLSQNIEQINTPEFKAWFGDSKAVDAGGKPIVVFHGSKEVFDTFDPAFAEREDSWSFSDNIDVARTYQPQNVSADKVWGVYQGLTGKDKQRFEKELDSFRNEDGEIDRESIELWVEEANNDDPQLFAGDLASSIDAKASDFYGEPEGQMVAAYLRLENPIEIWYDAKGNITKEVRPEGEYDGYIHHNVMDTNDPRNAWIRSTVYQVLKPEQIKSATGNRGTFDPNDPNILNQKNKPGEGANFTTGDLSLVNPAVRAAVESRISKLPAEDQQRIRANLEEHKSTAWAAAAVKGMAYREMLERAMAGQDISDLTTNQIWGKQDMAATKLVQAFQKYPQHGEKILKVLMNSYDFIGGNRKAENDISTSFTNCNPSKACAVHCYAAGSNARPNEIAKSEFTEFMIEHFPAEMTEKIVGDYMATAAGKAGLSLRLNDKGDLSPAQVTLIGMLNEKGVAVQVFSKRPELLRSLSDLNLKMLSVDGTNMEVAEANPDLRLAVVITDEMTEEMLMPIHDRVSVYLPVNLKGQAITQEELRSRFPNLYGRMRKENLCPVDGGKLITKPGTSFVDIKDGTSEKGVWTCTACDLYGNAGCFKGDRATNQRKAQTISVSSLTRDLELKRVRKELQSNLDSLLSLGGIDGELHKQLSQALSSGQRSVLEFGFTGTEGSTAEGSGGTVAPGDNVGSGTGRNAGILAQPGATDNRGGFSPESLTLILGKKADLSTFPHESAHFYLKVLGDLASRPDAPAQIRQDMEKTLAWFGVQGDPGVDAVTVWNAMSLEEQRPYHEKWAESFEAYLFSGKAPSIELQPVFSRFKQWMLRVYQSFKDFAAGHPDAEVNPEVAAIFDRLLATDEQIKLAEQARSMMPLFGTEEQSGMTPGEWAAYQELAQEPTDEAKAELNAKGVRDLTWLRRLHARMVKKYNAEAAALREQEAIEARKEVMTQPIYQAWAYLTGKAPKAEQDGQVKKPASPDEVDETRDSLLVAIAKLGGIARDSAMENLGVHKDEIGRREGIRPLFRKEGGKSADDMGQALMERGYLERDENDLWSLRELEAKIQDEISGTLHYSSNADYDFLLNGPAAAATVNPSNYGKLDLDTLREMGLPEELVNHLKALRMTGKDGVHPDRVAEQFGFSSGDELARRLAAANTPKEAIEALVDQRMLENHGEFASPQAIATAVDAAIHNEARARLVATELRFIAQSKLGAGEKGASVRVLMAAAKSFADQILGRKKIRELSSAQFISAASRAAVNARQAMDGGKHDIAAAELRNQLLNTTAANRAIGAKQEVERAVKYLKKFLHGNSRNSIDVDYLDQIDRLLERFDLKPVSNKELDKRTALSKWLTEQEDAGLEPDIPDYLVAEANRTHYKNLTLDEFRGLVDTVRQIEHLGRLKNRLLTTRDKRAFDEVVKTLRASIDANNVKGRKADNIERDTWVSRAAGMWKGAMAAHRKIASMVRELDGFKDGGPMWEYFLRSMNLAGDHEATMREQATVKLNEIFQPLLKQGRMGGKGIYIPAIDRSLNRGERLAVALNVGNEGNLQRLMSGYQWSPLQVRAVLATLTKDDLESVQKVWDFFDSYRPQIAAKERRVSGKEPAWIEPTPITVTAADGTEVSLRGGYYPIKYDPRQSIKAGQHQDAEDAKAMMRAAYTAATTRRSFTKTRAEEVTGRPLLLSPNVMFTGLSEVVHDLAWHEWLIDANKLIRAVGQDINDIYGAEWVTQFKRGLEDIARGEQGATNTIEKAANHLRTGATVAGLGWNLTTSLLQPLGLTQSMVRIGPTWVAKGMMSYLSDPVHALEKITARSEFMRVRAKTMMREINEIQNQIGGKGKIRTATEATFFVLIQKVQLVADIPTWLGAYEKAMSESTDEARAVALADQAVVDSQGGGQTKDLSMVQRGHPAWKLFTNFYSFFNVALNLGIERTRATNFKKPAEVARLAGDYLLLYSVPAVLGSLLKDVLKGGDDDEDKLISKLIAEQISYLLGLFVGLREITAAAQKMLGVSQFNTAYGGPAGLRFFQELDKLGQQIGQGEWDDALRKSAINTAGILFHLPSGQVNRTIDGTAALVEGRTSNPLAPVVGPPPKN